MGDFFAELKRRHIYRVGAGYVVVAWVLAQMVDLLSQIFQLSSSIAQPAILLLAAGLPVTLVIAWIMERKPQQVIGAAVHSSSSTVDWALFAAVAVLIALTGYQQIAQSSVTPAPSGVQAAREAAASPATALSIAVLPFANLSGDASQEFFSDGITEEITTALAKVPDMRVVARTSAYRFKGQNLDMQNIGQQLHATHLIEGSVRKAGERVRITAQLIKTDDGTHVWAESYDRDLTDVFAIQEDIARAIASSLRMPLGLRQGENLVSGTKNLGTYQEYLQAKAWLRERTSPRSGPFLETLESVVARDPGFAPAWAALAGAYAFQITQSPAVGEGPIDTARRIVQSFGQKAEMAAQKAIELDPRHPGGYAATANLRWRQGRWVEAEDAVKQGLALDPNDPDVLFSYTNILLKTGQPEKALALVQEVRALEPLVPAYDTTAGMIMQVNGQTEAGIAVLEAIPSNSRSVLAYLYLARAYAAAERYKEAADTLLDIVARVSASRTARKGLQDAAAILRSAPAVAANPKALPRLGDGEGDLFFVYTTVGAFDKALDYPERESQIQYMPDFGKTVWSAAMAPARKTERFKKIVRDAGLVEYWRAKGWPDFCRPTTGDDFECH